MEKKLQKEKKDLISVIVPVYNVESYLERCLKSLTEQSYSNIEIILVDDGSTDGSGRICDQYRDIDDRINVIHKTNGGLADARNAGLDVAKGEYIAFVDSDDWVSPYYIGNLYSALTEAGADLAISMYINVTGDEIKTEATNELANVRICSNEESLKQMLLQRGIETSSPGKLYRMSSVGDLRFPKGKLYEDIMFTTTMLSRAGKVAIIDNIDYYYYQRPGSIRYRQFSKQKMDCIYNSQELLAYIDSNHRDLDKEAISWYFSGLCNILFQIPYGEYSSEHDYIWAEIKKNRLQVLLNREARMKNRGAALLSFLGEKPMKTIYRKIQMRG